MLLVKPTLLVQLNEAPPVPVAKRFKASPSHTGLLLLTDGAAGVVGSERVTFGPLNTSEVHKPRVTVKRE